MAIHVPVLLEEAVAALAIRPDGTYVDATFGRGGHARAHPRAARRRAAASSRSIAIPTAEARARDASTIRASCFAARGSRNCADVLAALRHRARRRRAARPRHLLAADRRSGARILASRRRAARHADGPDARRIRGRIPCACRSARELTEVIRDYGEERFAQSIARAIVAARADAPVVRTRQLAAIVAKAVGARTRGDWSQDPATRTFQALRIFVNRELAELALTLPRIVALLAPRRPARGDQLPFARGPDREALLRARVAAVRRRSAARAPARSPSAALPGAPLVTRRARDPRRASDEVAAQSARAQRDAARRRAHGASDAADSAGCT